MSPARRGFDRRVLWGMVGAWLAAVAVGMGLLLRYSAEAGAVADAPAMWPHDTTLPRGADHTLVFVAHPRCPCTRASIAELSWLTTHLRDRMQTHVLFIAPEGTDEDWTHTDLWESAASLDGVTVVSDPGGREAARFGAQTSGQAYLFDPQGRLRYEGGITPSRGHQGDSLGRQRIVDIVAGDPAGHGHGAVYGCALEDGAVAEFWLPGLRGAQGAQSP